MPSVSCLDSPVSAIRSKESVTRRKCIRGKTRNPTRSFRRKAQFLRERGIKPKKVNLCVPQELDWEWKTLTSRKFVNCHISTNTPPNEQLSKRLNKQLNDRYSSIHFRAPSEPITQHSSFSVGFVSERPRK